jgi:hypothetical protein
MLRKISCKYVSIRYELLLAWTKIRSVKTASHLSASNFQGIFVATDAALLTQGKDNKAKSTEKGRRQAVRVRLPSPYRKTMFFDRRGSRPAGLAK